MPEPGILHVLTDPGVKATLEEFHDWYNNEHGPDRMRLSGFQTGVRYEAIDGLSPPWLATYELNDIALLQQPVYTRLRETRSQRERDLISRLDVLDRRIYKLIETRGTFIPANDNVAVTVGLVVPTTSRVELQQWYKQEHIDMLAQVPGWQRSRLLLDVSDDLPPESDVAHYLAIHEYTGLNGLDGPEHQAAVSTPWRFRVMSYLVKMPPIRRIFRLHHVFSKPSNDLATPVFPHDLRASLIFPVQGSLQEERAITP